MLMKEHGLRILAGGFVLHSDGRRRYWSDDGVESIRSRAGLEVKRGQVRGFSRASCQRLELIVASAANEFRSMVTLTYHALAAAWEGDAERNARIVKRSKRDLNRFISTMRPRLGAYVWVQEFQARGVVHYHLLCELPVDEDAVSLAWCRATESLDDASALLHAAKVEVVRAERQARWYLSRYIGKARQKELPEGVGAAGRWWSRSRSVELAELGRVVVLAEGETVARRVESRVVRSLRRFLSGELRFRYRGGMVVDWNSTLTSRAAALAEHLTAFYEASEPHPDLLGSAS